MFICYSRWSHKIFHQGNSAFFPTGFLTDLEGVWLPHVLAQEGTPWNDQHLARSLLEALAQGNASASIRECEGAAEGGTAQNTSCGHTQVLHAPGTTGQPKWGVSARMNQEWLIFGVELHPVPLPVTAHTMHTEHTQSILADFSCAYKPLSTPVLWRLQLLPVARKWSDIRIRKFEPLKFWRVGIRVRFEH